MSAGKQSLKVENNVPYFFCLLIARLCLTAGNEHLAVCQIKKSRPSLLLLDITFSHFGFFFPPSRPLTLTFNMFSFSAAGASRSSSTQAAPPPTAGEE